MEQGEFEGQDEIVGEFLIESEENLDRLDHDLLALERDPGDQAVLASVFRTMHTIKGTAGFLGFGNLESLTHAAESLLSLVRDGECQFSAAIASALLATSDAVRTMLANVKQSGTDGDDGHKVLRQRLESLQTQAPTDEANATTSVDRNEAALELPLGDEKLGGVTSSVGETSIRVDIGVLDRLMNLVGELVLARNQVLQHAGHTEDLALLTTSQRLNLITTELQEGVMKTRMQPIGTLWTKFPRVVRDLSALCKKQIRIEMEGQDTELDRTILEAIKDPLTHAIRNAVDHGIETPEERLAAGKPAEGQICLRAFHEGGQVNIEIADDGGGIRADRVRAKALARGLVTAEQVERMSDRDLVNLIFLPGFSTAEQVSNVSGRGVGMDVVKHNIEKIGGTIDVTSQPGEGTALKLKIPLTLAIIPALVINSGGERYAIPQVNLLELVRLEGGQVGKRIENLRGASVYRRRGQLLPLIELAGALGERGAPLTSRDTVNIVVLQAGEVSFGLVVGGIVDTEEIVVKPLSAQLKGVGVFSGATIMGDGKVALILDVIGLAQHAGVVAASADSRAESRKSSHAANDTELEPAQLLICEVGQGARFGIPLGAVHRLEDFVDARSERIGDSAVIQYRGDILPLVPLANLLPDPSLRAAIPDGHMRVVVHHHEGRQYGLVVHRILDVVVAGKNVDSAGRRPGVTGSAIIAGSVTELVDVPVAISMLVGKLTASLSDDFGAGLEMLEVA